MSPFKSLIDRVRRSDAINAFENDPDPIFVTALNGKILSTNKSARELLAEEEKNGQPLLHPEHQYLVYRCRDLGGIVTADTKFGNHNVFWEYRPSGDRVLLYGHIRLGSLRQLNTVLNDINQGLAEQVVRDPLTGLNNRLGIKPIVTRVFNDVQRGREKAVTLVMADIDLFRNHNLHGHPYGDEILKGLASKLGMVSNSIWGRWGGEEFLGVVFHNNETNSREENRGWCGRLQEMVANLETKETVTISLGLYTLFSGASECQSEEKWIWDTDQALLHAKRTGRNRFVFWEEVPQGLRHEYESSQSSHQSLAESVVGSKTTALPHQALG